jgi:alcohol dehydrogenase class IV
LSLHGDLVFDKKLVQAIVNHPAKSIGLINKSIPKPEKDFKGRVINGEIKEVGIGIFDDDCYAFQPLYKLAKEDILAWWQNVATFVKAGVDKVYAENALNEITDRVHIKAVEYDEFFIDEIDNPDDYARVSKRIESFDFDEQERFFSLDAINSLDRPLVIVSKSLKDKFGGYKTFSDFKPNPTYDDVTKAIKAFRGCKSLASVGGGSAIDLAKAVKYYKCLDKKGNFVYKNIKHYAVPTTAGSGAESTRFAVIYINGEKQSLTHDALFPDAAVFVPQLLKTLPLYQKKCTLLDALCHAIESIWSNGATNESVKFARAAIEIIKRDYAKYLDGDESATANIQQAANLAGRAINISRTTAAHAMSYKITTLFALPHGHAVALTMPALWRLIERDNPAKLKDENITAQEFDKIVVDLGVETKLTLTDAELDTLASSVNTTRLSNFPLALSTADLRAIYASIRK